MRENQVSFESEEFKDARNFLIVCPAVEETRSEGADVDGIHKIFLVRKADKILQLSYTWDYT